MRVTGRAIGLLSLGFLLFVQEGSGDEPKLAKLDLAKAGEIDNSIEGGKQKAPWTLTMQAPEGAKMQRIYFNSRIFITATTPRFNLEIRHAKVNSLAEEKKKWVEDKATKKLVVDRDDTLMREVEFPADKTPRYQLVKYKKVGDNAYILTGGGSLGVKRADADLMLKCADTLSASK